MNLSELYNVIRHKCHQKNKTKGTASVEMKHIHDKDKTNKEDFHILLN